MTGPRQALVGHGQRIGDCAETRVALCAPCLNIQNLPLYFRWKFHVNQWLCGHVIPKYGTASLISIMRSIRPQHPCRRVAHGVAGHLLSKQQHSPIPPRRSRPKTLRIRGVPPRGPSPRKRGNLRKRRYQDPDAGPSPRKRGNPWRGAARPDNFGSIPAQAGEPPATRMRVWAYGVHPRASGGTGAVDAAKLAFEGTSPRKRGNPRAVRRRGGRPGDIPAQAGEPLFGPLSGL